MIGIECFKHLMNDSRLDGIPLIVEARPPAATHGLHRKYCSNRDAGCAWCNLPGSVDFCLCLL